MGGSPFLNLDETQEQHIGFCESARQMLGRAFALFLVSQWGVYIGETGNFLRRRVTVHNQQIRDPNTRILFVSEHLNVCA